MNDSEKIVNGLLADLARYFRERLQAFGGRLTLQLLYKQGFSVQIDIRVIEDGRGEVIVKTNAPTYSAKKPFSEKAFLKEQKLRYPP